MMPNFRGNWSSQKGKIDILDLKQMSPVAQILLPGENSAICSTYSSVLGHMTSELLHCQALAMKNSTVIGKTY